MTLRSDLIAARAQFHAFGSKSIQAAHMGACHNSPTALASLVALRTALPVGYRDFRDFENSRHWRRKDAYAVFDRAIASADEEDAS